MGFLFWVNQIPLLVPGLKPEFWSGSKLGIDLLDGLGLSAAMPANTNLVQSSIFQEARLPQHRGMVVIMR
ncbi:hypothetical protein Pyn_37943 [Prunus yedoensis var. nudiflora]|uniref:Uncharacterized protein n=1 Tax=Prunus yedoensis var. nudiflora TaxID=2094558 RepID=A0A314V432_PRUYE|nr:hypothetical protein Pyn_37943 [Prunus yedoensis var. nudiflora]